MATKRRKVNRGKIMGCVLLVAGVVLWGLLVGQIYRIYHSEVSVHDAIHLHCTPLSVYLLNVW